MKKYFAGLATGLIIALPLGVIAGTGIHDTKIADDTKLVVNGKQVNTDIVYGVLDSATDGKNYVSARDLSEALGYDVSWDGASKTITVGGKDDSVDNTTVAEPTTTICKYTPPEEIINNSDYILKDNGIYYITSSYIDILASKNGYSVKYNATSKKFEIVKKVNNEKIFTYEGSEVSGITCVTYDYYVDNIEPLLK